ncbi:MAG: aminomethyl-transferring glycine dehydrogenase subunit GcvPB [Candidatus Asgardarchaeia archaeon]
MKGFRQAGWKEPLIFEMSRKGRVGFSLPEVPEEYVKEMGRVEDLIPESLLRKEAPKLPEVSEVDVVNHFTRLSQMNYGVDLGFYPLGSCTMKYNPKLNERIARLEGFLWLHPYQDEGTIQGALEVIYRLQRWISEITGMEYVSLQPSAGAQGELTGMLIVRTYLEDEGLLGKKREVIVPDSAHGTNPASAAMAGFKVLEIPSDEDGCVDMDALKASVCEETAALMLTNPNTLGIFEDKIEEIAEVVHSVGALLYYDGANLNANLCKVRPGDLGFDILHVNFHKTFSTPHGGGGPGAGAIAVKDKLKDYLPIPIVEYDEERGRYYLNYDLKKSIGKVRGFYGNFPVLLRAFSYVYSMGFEGLKMVAEDAVLSANYIAKEMSKIRGITLPYGKGKYRKHEVVLSLERMKRDTGVRASDFAKRILDFGLHAPTIYFPHIVEEALMVEPTESFGKDVLDRYVEVFKKISEEAYRNPEVVRKSPKNTAVERLDEVYASKPKTMVLSWRFLRGDRFEGEG